MRNAAFAKLPAGTVDTLLKPENKDQLVKILAGTVTAKDLAEKIKALKAANSIEATPQRARQKHSTAEEPITARIRRRQEAGATDQSVDAEQGEPAPAPEMPAPSFQERILRERQLKDQEPSLP